MKSSFLDEKGVRKNKNAIEKFIQFDNWAFYRHKAFSAAEYCDEEWKAHREVLYPDPGLVLKLESAVTERDKV